MRKNKMCKVLAGCLAVLTAVSPVFSCMGAATVSAQGLASSILIEDYNGKTDTKSETTVVVEDERSAKHHLSIGLKTGYGQVSVQTADGHSYKMQSIDGKQVVVTNNEGKVLDQGFISDEYTYTFVTEKAMSYTIEAIADKDYNVATYSVTMDAGGKEEKTSFKEDAYDSYEATVKSDVDKSVTIGFATNEIVIGDVEDDVKTDIVIEDDKKDDAKDEVKEDTSEDTSIVISPEDADVDTSVITDWNFQLKRLLVFTADAKNIAKDDKVVTNYGDLYILEYNTKEDAKVAYGKYLDNKDVQVEPDTLVYGTYAKQEGNATLDANDVIKQSSEQDIKAGSVVVMTSQDEAEFDQASSILSINKDANIITLDVLDANGIGTMSNVLVSMLYALENNASVMQCNWIAQSMGEYHVLETVLDKAVEAGVPVVVPVGEGQNDIESFVMGQCEIPYHIAMAYRDGMVADGTNYGKVVDYNVIANSTVEAASKFTGYVSLLGVDNLEINKGDIYDHQYSSWGNNEPINASDTNSLAAMSPLMMSPLMMSNRSESQVTIVSRTPYEVAGREIDPSSFIVDYEGEQLFGVCCEMLRQHQEAPHMSNFVTKSDNDLLRKILWYGHTGPGDIEFHPGGTVLAASIANNCPDEGQIAYDDTLGEQYIATVENLPSPPAEFEVFIADITGHKNGQDDWNFQDIAFWRYQEIKPDVMGSLTIEKSLMTANEPYKTLYELGGKDIYPVVGAQFKIYGPDDRNMLAGTIDITSENNGVGSGKLEGLTPGIYFVQESKLPKNSVYGGTLKSATDKMQIEVNGDTTFNVENKIIGDPSLISLVKSTNVDAPVSGAMGGDDFTGTQFTLFYFADEIDRTSGIPESLDFYTKRINAGDYDQHSVWEIKDSSGLLYFDKESFVRGSFVPQFCDEVFEEVILPIGTYVCVETQAPKNYELTDVRMLASIYATDTMGGISKTWLASSVPMKGDVNINIPQKPDTAYANFTEMPDKHMVGLEIQKFDRDFANAQGDANLGGITYGVWNKSPNAVAITVNGKTYNYAPNAQMTALSMTTDAKGYASTPCVLPNGKYTVKEIASNNQYELTDTKVHTYTINGNYADYSATTRFYPDGYDSADANTGSNNDVYRAGANLTKVDGSSLKPIPQGGGSLKDAKYVIINGSDTSVTSVGGNEVFKTVKPQLDKTGINYNALHALYKANASTQCVVATLKTDSKGYASVPNNTLPVGTYYVIEVEASNGYLINNDWVGTVKVTGSADKGKSLPIKAYADSFGVKAGSTITPEMVIRTEAEITKVDDKFQKTTAQGNGSLAGAEYTLINACDTSITNVDGSKTFGTVKSLLANPTYKTIASLISQNKNNCIVEVLKTDEKGYAITSKDALPCGTYYVIETKSPESYALNTEYVGIVNITKDEVTKVTALKDAALGTQAGDETTPDTIYRGGATITKVDSNLDRTEAQGDAALVGAEFTIVNASNASITNADGSVVYGTIKMALNNNVTYAEIAKHIKANTDNCVIDTIVTDAKGSAKTALDTLPVGTYYVIETKAPTGYFVNDKWVGVVTLKDKADAKVLHPVKAYADYSFADYSEADMSIDNVDVVAGKVETPEMIYRGGVAVQKFDSMRNDDRYHGDAMLSDAEFTIVNASGTVAVNSHDKEIVSANINDKNATYANVKSHVKTSAMGVITTDYKGDAQTTEWALPYGTYYVIETKAPAGYFVNEDWVGKVVVREDGKIYDVTTISGANRDNYNDSYYESIGHKPVITDGDAFATRDQIYRAGISVQKVDEELQEARPQGTGTMKGAIFTILNASQDSIRNKDGHDIPSIMDVLTPQPVSLDDTKANSEYDTLRELADSGEFTVQTMTTNVEGFAITGSNDLPYGTYVVIETQSPDGYYIDDTFVGVVQVREDDVIYHLGTKYDDRDGFFITAGEPEDGTVDETPRRADLSFIKVNIDGNYKPYIPFMISAIRVNPDGSETILESHVMVSDKNGRVDTSRSRDKETVNGLDAYVKNKTVTPEGEALLKEAANWGVWFQGNATDAPKDAINNTEGALYTSYYRITELHCEDNKGLEENLLASDRMYIDNTETELSEVLDNKNDQMHVHHPLVDTEIVLESEALDVESETQTVPARESVDVKDSVSFTHVSADHTYRMETQFVDLTNGGRIVPIVGTSDEDAVLSDDGLWVTKEFQPKKQSGTNNTYGDITMYATLNTKELNGHTLMAVDYLYEYVDFTENDKVDGDWVLVAIHPASGETDENQMLYIPDMATDAKDVATNDRVGTISETSSIYDIIGYENLAKHETYVFRMTAKNTETGEYVATDKDGEPIWVNSKPFFKRSETPYKGTMVMPELAFDTSKYTDGTSVTVIEELYRADEDGNPMGEPILVHDSLLDEDQTIRYIKIQTTASDGNTLDTVGSNRNNVLLRDVVSLENVVFDDDDNDGMYTYKLTGHLVYQKDFTDANGKKHKAGDVVKTLDGTKDTVNITSDAAGNITFIYEDGSQANGKIVKSSHKLNVGNQVVPENEADNSYVTDPKTLVADLEVELLFQVNSNELEGGTVVAFEQLYHDSVGANSVLVATHEDIKDESQTVHYSKVRTSAMDNQTKDDVGALVTDAKIIDTVILENLVPGYDYQVVGILKDQTTGKDFLVNGEPVKQMASITVTKDGKIVAADGERTEVTSYNADLKEVCGTVDLTFSFDATGLEDKTAVVFEDLRHNGITIATHSDLTDKNQTVHFPKVRTTNNDGFTLDHVGTVTGKEIVVDTVLYHNLVIGRTYTVNGVLMNKATDKVLLDANGDEVRATRTFVAGDEEDGLVVTEKDKDKGFVNGTVDITFEFDSSLLAGETVVAFEDLVHNDIIVATHSDLGDEEQTIHYPKVETSALDGQTLDEVGTVAPTQIRDTVLLSNLIPGEIYEVKGLLMNKTTGEPLLVDGKTVEQSAMVAFTEDGEVDATISTPCHCDDELACSCENGSIRVLEYSKVNNYVNATAMLVFDVDASDLAGETVVVFEDLYHNDIKVSTHTDLSDLAQTIHYPEISTNAIDADTSDNAGTVKDPAIIIDTVSYKNLVIGRTYTLEGTLYNQETGNPIIGVNGRPITQKATFEATTESSKHNTVLAVNEENQVVSGEYVLTFKVNSELLAGQTVVVFEDLYHNDILVTTHSDLKDQAQSVHYPEIGTLAYDETTGDHVGTIWGSLINWFKQLFGDKDADGNDILDNKQQNIIDVVKLENLVPGYTYVVSGKLYDVDASLEAGENIPLVIDGEEIIQSTTITVSEDGKSIKATGDCKTTVTKFDKENFNVDGTVELVYSLDSSKVQGHKLVVFEHLYQDASYTPETDSTTVEEEDMIHEHADITDEGQSVSEVSIHTTAIDTTTGDHTGVVPQNGNTSIIKDTVNMTHLIPDMEYKLVGYVVDLGASNFEDGKVVYIGANGEGTEDINMAVTQGMTFVANETEEDHELNFGLTSDKIQGKTLTIFEMLFHNDVLISMHPAGNIEDLNSDDFASQTVYYPTGKTNATNNETGSHTSDAKEETVITDRVYFENLMVGKTYEIAGELMYQTSFTDADGNHHEAGSPVDGANATVSFEASKDLVEATYIDEDGEDAGKAVVDSVVTSTTITGETVISGYVSLEFVVNTEKLAGQSVVAFETFSKEDVVLFVHADLTDKGQTVRVPAIGTTATVDTLDEAAVYDENGDFKEITITDTVAYTNLWTQAELDTMKEDGKQVIFEDGTVRDDKDIIYDINEVATYMLKGVLMDKETGEMLVDNDGNIYEVYSTPFTPESNSGTHALDFVLNPADFVVDGVSTLEGKSLVVFEDLYMAKKAEDCVDSTHIGAHKDLSDTEQDIRFPSVHTNAVDSTLDMLDETSTSYHEAFGGKEMQITDTVSFSNLHGNTIYTISGTLQKVVEYDENNVPVAWEAAKDDAGNPITASATLDTSTLSENFDDQVSGTIDLIFTFDGANLRGETVVAFETLSREDIVVGVHADITDDKQTVYVPLIHTNASDALSCLNEMFADKNAIVLDDVSYENLEYGKTYDIKATLHKQSDGTEVESTEVIGKFTAGVDNQFVFADGTAILTPDEFQNALYETTDKVTQLKPEFVTDADASDELGEVIVKPDVDGENGEVEDKTEVALWDFANIFELTQPKDLEDAGDATHRVDGIVTVVIPVDATALAGESVVAFEEVSVEVTEDVTKVVAEHKDIEDEAQTVKVPKMGTSAKIDGDNRTAIASKEMTAVDTVYYENLTPGREYTVRGELMDKATNTSIQVTAETTFTPKEPNGSVEVEFVFDGTGLADRYLVVFETLTTKTPADNDYVVAEHKDIDDGAQTVFIEKPAPDVVVDDVQTGDVGMWVAFAIGLLATVTLLFVAYKRAARRKRA